MAKADITGDLNLWMAEVNGYPAERVRFGLLKGLEQKTIMPVP
jgi:hypothetical protein